MANKKKGKKKELPNKLYVAIDPEGYFNAGETAESVYDAYSSSNSDILDVATYELTSVRKLYRQLHWK